jgi:hypothetical protein
LTAHYECDFENTTAETLANFLFETLTRIMRTAMGVDKNDNSRTAEYQTSQVEYLDPKDGKTTQHALIVHGKKVRPIGKDDLRAAEPLTVISEMLIITVTQGVSGSHLRFDSNELPSDAFKNLVEWILLDIGKTATVQIKDIQDKISPPKQEQSEIKTPKKQSDPPLAVPNAGSNDAIRVSNQETTSSETPRDRKSASKKTQTLRKSNIAIIVAIGFAGTIIAALLSSPLIEKWFSPVSVPTATITFTYSPVPQTKTLEPSLTPTMTREPELTATPVVFNPHPDSSDYIDTFGVPMRLVLSGEFTMGSDAYYSSDEIKDHPVHTVYLDTFYIDKFEVSNALYEV